MKKIPTIFERTTDRRHVVVNQVTPGCEWVFDPHQAHLIVATRKLDGACMRYSRGNWWSRRQVKSGQITPPGFVRVHFDLVTETFTGWEPAIQSAFAKHVTEAITSDRVITADHRDPGREDTFELVGPKVNGNPDHFEHHTLFSHSSPMLHLRPDQWRPGGDLTLLMALCAQHGWEGIVWHHQDGRMAKLKVRDFPKGELLP